MTLRAICVQEPLWEGASPTRRAEWRLDARRRLFSLVVALLADTTRRAWAHRHL